MPIKPNFAFVLLFAYLFFAFFGNREVFPSFISRLFFSVPSLLYPFSSLFRYRDKREKEKHFSRICFVLAIIFLVLAVGFIWPLNTQIGSPFEMEEYTEKYYIMASSDDGKTFTKTPATIVRNIDNGEGYFVKSCYVGSDHLRFSEGLWGYDTNPEEETYLYDQYGNEWIVILSTTPAREVTRQFDKFNCVCAAIFAFSFIVFAAAAFNPSRCSLTES